MLLVVRLLRPADARLPTTKSQLQLWSQSTTSSELAGKLDDAVAHLNKRGVSDAVVPVAAVRSRWAGGDRLTLLFLDGGFRARKVIVKDVTGRSAEYALDWPQDLRKWYSATLLRDMYFYTIEDEAASLPTGCLVLPREIKIAPNTAIMMLIEDGTVVATMNPIPNNEPTTGEMPASR